MLEMSEVFGKQSKVFLNGIIETGGFPHQDGTWLLNSEIVHS